MNYFAIDEVNLCTAFGSLLKSALRLGNSLPPEPSYPSVNYEVHVPKKLSSAINPQFGAKAAFIRSMPANMPAKEVVIEANKVGIKITEGHIYNLRSSSTKRPKSPAATITVSNGGVSVKRGPGRPRKVLATVTASPVAAFPVAALRATTAFPATADEASLRRAIAEVGLTRARAVFADVEAAFGAR